MAAETASPTQPSNSHTGWDFLPDLHLCRQQQHRHPSSTTHHGTQDPESAIETKDVKIRVPPTPAQLSPLPHVPVFVFGTERQGPFN